MYYVIKQSTDMRDPRTEIRKTTSLNSARKIAKRLGGGHHTHGNPEVARNYHHSFCHIYELMGKVNRKDPIFSDFGTPTYPRNKEDQLAHYINKYGSELNHE